MAGTVPATIFDWLTSLKEKSKPCTSLDGRLDFQTSVSAKHVHWGHAVLKLLEWEMHTSKSLLQWVLSLPCLKHLTWLFFFPPKSLDYLITKISDILQSAGCVAALVKNRNWHINTRSAVYCLSYCCRNEYWYSIFVSSIGQMAGEMWPGSSVCEMIFSGEWKTKYFVQYHKCLDLKKSCCCLQLIYLWGLIILSVF